jgi:hypothetical protein
MFNLFLAYCVAALIHANNMSAVNIPTPSGQTCWIDTTDQMPSQCQYEPTKEDKQYITNVMYWLGRMDGVEQLE